MQGWVESGRVRQRKQGEGAGLPGSAQIGGKSSKYSPEVLPRPARLAPPPGPGPRAWPRAAGLGAATPEESRLGCGAAYSVLQVAARPIRGSRPRALASAASSVSASVSSSGRWGGSGLSVVDRREAGQGAGPLAAECGVIES